MIAWETLIKRYADGRQICNCGRAYYTNCGEALIGDKRVFDYPVCQYGCQANQYSVKEYIAKRVLAELKDHASTD